ncbi:MAG: glycosyltransferase family 25 protein [Holosporaceae bacterium]|jgi:GR25 family glycosyltransferase involved in LPS biosynthesis|nr:glycosyltransferase family 25 protein [Holosporaceae bacterium]
MRRILALFTYNALILFCAALPAYAIAACASSDSPFQKIALLLPFAPLFTRGRLFRNSCNSPVNSKEFSAGKIAAYLLNMDRATERSERIMPRMRQLGFPFERIAAVDGNLLSKEKIRSVTDLESYVKYFRMPPEVGTVGCSLSHEKAWRKFLESDNEFAMIFEDDACFDGAELASLTASLIDKKELWDIVGMELNHRGHPMKIAELPNGRFLAAYLTDVKHAGCYLINRRAARKLLEKFYPLKMPLDHYYTSSWEFNLKFAGAEPRPVKQKFTRSQIKISPNARVNSVAVRTANAIYLFKRHTMHAIYNFYYFLSPGK